MSIQRLSRRGQKRAAGASACAVLAVLAGAAVWPGTASATVNARKPAAVTISAAPLGVDVGNWDPNLSSADGRPAAPAYSTARTLATALPLLKAAGIDQLRYSSGTLTDQYDWQNNVSISGCNTNLTSLFTTVPPPACTYNPALTFAKFSADARSIGAQSSVMVNYGTGWGATEPDFGQNLAKAWVAKAATTAGQGVTDWAIGNENYGCWEPNNFLAGAPEFYPTFNPYSQSTAACPMREQGLAAGMTTMATSYAVNAGHYMTAMKAADPAAQIGVPWAFDGGVGGASVSDNTEWNNEILSTDAADISFVDAHWYPSGVDDPSIGGTLHSLFSIPGEYAKIESGLQSNGDPSAKIVVGETGVSNANTHVVCSPAGAVFAAGDVLTWLAAGAQTVDWWPLDTAANLGSTCTNPDEGMFTNKGVPNPPYYGYVLASALARPGAQLSALATSDPAAVLAYQSVLPGGKVAVALINTSPSLAERVTVSTSLAGSLATEKYSAGNQNTSNSKIVMGTTTVTAVDGGVTLPADSVLILRDSPAKATLRLAVSARTVKPGTKVTATAILKNPHADKVTLYAQPKGGARTVIGQAMVNSAGKFSVVYAVKVNTNFTVVLSGDAWYAPESVTVPVKA